MENRRRIHLSLRQTSPTSNRNTSLRLKGNGLPRTQSLYKLSSTTKKETFSVNPTALKKSYSTTAEVKMSRQLVAIELILWENILYWAFEAICCWAKILIFYGPAPLSLILRTLFDWSRIGQLQCKHHDFATVSVPGIQSCGPDISTTQLFLS